jgi:DNA invertase Pin-like site-specific DNA recombinase
VAAQEAKARAYAAERWPDHAVAVFCDNDLSAANGGYRPGFEALVDAVRRGEVAQVVCAEQSRLTRVPAEWEHLVVTLAKAGIDEIHTYRKGVVAITGSKLVGRILAAVDAEEVEVLRARVRDKLDRLAQEGRPRGGKEFGYQPGRNDRGEATLEVIPEHADHARWAAAAILDGWTLSAVARRWNELRVPLVRGGKRWDPTAVRKVLTKASIAGLIFHNGDEVRATWEPILDVETWRQVRVVLDGRARTKQRPTRRYLLTGGIARCGRPECGAPLGAQQMTMRSPNRHRVVPYYLCLAPARGGCSRLGIIAEPFEQYVSERLLDELDKPEFLAAFTDDDHEPERARIEAELRAVAAQRTALARLVAARDMSTDEWREARAVLDADEARLSAGLAAVPAPMAHIDPQVIRGAWDDVLTLDEKRQIVGMFIDQVIVHPAKPGKRRFDVGRVEIIWRIQ